MRGGRFLSCRHGAMGGVHLVVVHGPGHGVDFSGIVCSNVCGKVSKKGKKKFQRFFFIILGENLACTFFFFTKDDLKDFFLSSLVEKKSERQPGVRFFSRLHNLKKHFDHTGTRVPTLNNMICASSIF